MTVPLLATLLAVALLPPAAAPVAANTPTVATPSDQPEFSQDRVVDHRGDVTTVGVDLANHSEATLRIEPANESASQYTAEVVLYDRNGDGRVEVRLNTYAMGHDGRPISGAGHDTVRVRRTAALDHRLRVGAYHLVLESDNETVDQSTLAIQPASLDSLRVLTANGTQPANLSRRAGVEAAISNGTFEDDGRFSTRETLLIELEASGISGALASQSGSNATARFLDLLDSPGYSLTIRENGSTIDIHDDGVEFSPTAAATTVVPDPANDTYYVLLDIGRTPRSELDGPDRVNLIEPVSLFDVNVTVDGGVYESRESLTSQLRIEPWVTVDTPLEVVAGPEQTIVVRSNLGDRIDPVVVLESDDGSFRAVRTADARGYGKFVATFDLSSVPAGTTLSIVVEVPDDVRFAEQDAVHVRSPTPTATATLTPTATAPGPTERTPTETSGSAPGFGAIAALLALAAATVISSRRRT